MWIFKFKDARNLSAVFQLDIDLTATSAGTTAETTAVTDIETTVPPGCSDLSWCSGYCNPDYSYIDPIDGCPACVCVTPSCGVRNTYKLTIETIFRMGHHLRRCV